tara:strand:+ start:593 stop:748 length:156 start_codon:yes stop_codon:yes gene_type:complete
MYDDNEFPQDMPRARVIEEILLHHLDPEEFFGEAGHHLVYTVEEVACWLGY